MRSCTGWLCKLLEESFGWGSDLVVPSGMGWPYQNSGKGMWRFWLSAEFSGLCFGKGLCLGCFDKFFFLG